MFGICGELWCFVGYFWFGWCSLPESLVFAGDEELRFMCEKRGQNVVNCVANVDKKLSAFRGGNEACV